MALLKGRLTTTKTAAKASTYHLPRHTALVFFFIYESYSGDQTFQLQKTMSWPGALKWVPGPYHNRLPFLPQPSSLFLPSDFSKKATQWESALQTDFFLRSQQEGESLDVSKASPFWGFSGYVGGERESLHSLVSVSIGDHVKWKHMQFIRFTLSLEELFGPYSPGSYHIPCGGPWTCGT